jgi:hypothetical protein
MAGSSLRWARSPVAPKIVSVVGWTGRRSSPSASGLPGSDMRVSSPYGLVVPYYPRRRSVALIAGPWVNAAWRSVVARGGR